MGLDQYAIGFKGKCAEAIKETERTTDIDICLLEAATGEKRHEIHYWRKHPALQGQMEQLYKTKEGNRDEFNCATVLLNEADLDDLEDCIKNDLLPENTTGFFFGNDSERTPEEKEADKKEDLAFIAKARQYIKEGGVVLYDSWW